MGILGQKLKMPKNMQKPILQEHYGCFVQKTAKKTPNNEK